MKKDIAVLGLGAFGRRVAVDLAEFGHNVLAVDQNIEHINLVKDVVSQANTGDLSSEAVIKELDIAKYDMIIVDLGDHLEELILCVTFLQNANAKRIICKVTRSIHREILSRLGIVEIIDPDEESSKRLASRINSPNIVEMFEVENGCFAKVTISKELSGKSLKDLKDSHNVSVVLIRKKGMKKDHLLFNHDFTLEEGDELTVIGDNEEIEKVFAAN